MITITLPFPPSKLSGHGNHGHWSQRASVVKKHRQWAFLATKDELGGRIVSGKGDLQAKVTFYPPNRRGDRLNYPNRMKPYFDGIADALGVNDKRFAVPAFECAEIQKPGKVVVEISGLEGEAA